MIERVVLVFEEAWRRAGDAWTLPWHVDQDDPDERGVQGILALSAQDARTGGLQLATEWTARDFERLVAGVHEKKAWPFVVCDEEQSHAVQPTLAPGDLVLWDSRALHRVVAPLEPERTERATVYLAFQPKDPALTEARTRAFYDGVATNHWSRRLVPRGAGRARTAEYSPAVAALL